MNFLEKILQELIHVLAWLHQLGSTIKYSLLPKILGVLGISTKISALVVTWAIVRGSHPQLEKKKEGMHDLGANGTRGPTAFFISKNVANYTPCIMGLHVKSNMPKFFGRREYQTMFSVCDKFSYGVIAYCSTPSVRKYSSERWMYLDVFLF